ncbi:unnamed protein product [Caenorhabditis bovis]|uniref:Receptor L-domain domain-containing protein n=1 Tax=Caenorhabditis bovis TaxID=2654633 RepID=A0A8S1EDE8_9PELO|nr:unnamed protein product [Caenorhabditis bovis]
MLKKLCALLILLSCADCEESMFFVPDPPNFRNVFMRMIDSNEYCSFTAFARDPVMEVAFSDRFPNCTSIAQVRIFMHAFAPEVILSRIENFQYMYDVELYIENVRVKKLDFSWLQKMTNVHLVIAHNKWLEEISIPPKALKNGKGNVIEIYDNPLLKIDDSSLPENGKPHQNTYFTYTDVMNRFVGFWCQYKSGTSYTATYFDPDPDLIKCQYLYDVRIYFSNWNTDEIHNFLSNLRAVTMVTMIIHRPKLESIDMTQLRIAENFEIHIVENEQLVNVYFSEELMRTPKYAASISLPHLLDALISIITILEIFSSNNNKLSTETYQAFQRICYSKCEIFKEYGFVHQTEQSTTVTTRASVVCTSTPSTTTTTRKPTNTSEEESEMNRIAMHSRLVSILQIPPLLLIIIFLDFK